MLKMNSLRDAFTRASRWCRASPEKMTVFTEGGTIATTGETPGFCYHYTLVVFVMDFPGHIDTFTLPLLNWLMFNQPDLLLNPEKNQDIKFTVAINDDDSADLLLEIPVRERVRVSRNENGELYAEHLPEPRPRFTQSDAFRTMFAEDAVFEETLCE